jgi:hypothetical protein
MKIIIENIPFGISYETPFQVFRIMSVLRLFTGETIFYAKIKSEQDMGKDFHSSYGKVEITTQHCLNLLF